MILVVPDDEHTKAATEELLIFVLFIVTLRTCSERFVFYMPTSVTVLQMWHGMPRTAVVFDTSFNRGNYKVITEERLLAGKLSIQASEVCFYLQGLGQLIVDCPEELLAFLRIVIKQFRHVCYSVAAEQRVVGFAAYLAGLQRVWRAIACQVGDVPLCQDIGVHGWIAVPILGQEQFALSIFCARAAAFALFEMRERDLRNVTTATTIHKFFRIAAVRRQKATAVFCEYACDFLLCRWLVTCASIAALSLTEVVKCIGVPVTALANVRHRRVVVCIRSCQQTTALLYIIGFCFGECPMLAHVASLADICGVPRGVLGTKAVQRRMLKMGGSHAPHP